LPTWGVLLLSGLFYHSKELLIGQLDLWTYVVNTPFLIRAVSILFLSFLHAFGNTITKFMQSPPPPDHKYKEK